jgi:hypothetical protein
MAGGMIARSGRASKRIVEKQPSIVSRDVEGR